MDMYRCRKYTFILQAAVSREMITHLINNIDHIIMKHPVIKIFNMQYLQVSEDTINAGNPKATKFCGVNMAVMFCNSFLVFDRYIRILGENFTFKN